jgi:hypothetical protein
MAEDTAGHVKCTRPSARIAKRNAKSLLSPEKTARFIAGIVFQNAKIAAVKQGT